MSAFPAGAYHQMQECRFKSQSGLKFSSFGMWYSLGVVAGSFFFFPGTVVSSLSSLVNGFSQGIKLKEKLSAMCK